MGEKKGMINYDCLKHKKCILWKHCSFSLVNDLDGVMFLYIYGRVNEKCGHRKRVGGGSTCPS